jgi:WD40 repeat protein
MSIQTELISKIKLDNPGCSLCILKFYDNCKDPQIINEYREHSKNILVVSLQNGVIDFMDVGTSKIISQYSLECQSEAWALRSMQLDPRSYLLIVGSAVGIIYSLSIEATIQEDKDITLNIVKKWSQKTGDMITKIDLVDINNDTKLELIVSSLDKTIRVLNPMDGKYIWGQIFQSGVTTFIVADINNDNKLELIAGAVNGSLRVFNGSDGNLLCYADLPNNIRTLSLIKKPESIESTPIETQSSHILLCGCDDMKIYFIDGNKCKKLHSIDEKAYVWLSMVIPTVPEKILVTTYSFDYMEGLVESEQRLSPSITMYETPHFMQEYRLDNANVQCVSEVSSRNGSFIVAFGTTEKNVNILNCSANTLDLTIKSDDIINGVLLERLNDRYLLCYCDDSSHLYVWQFH